MRTLFILSLSLCIGLHQFCRLLCVQKGKRFAGIKLIVLSMVIRLRKTSRKIESKCQTNVTRDQNNCLLYMLKKKRCFFCSSTENSRRLLKMNSNNLTGKLFWEFNFFCTVSFVLPFFYFSIYSKLFFSIQHIWSIHWHSYTHLLLVKCCCVTFLIEFVEKTIYAS